MRLLDPSQDCYRTLLTGSSPLLLNHIYHHHLLLLIIILIILQHLIILQDLHHQILTWHLQPILRWKVICLRSTS